MLERDDIELGFKPLLNSQADFILELSLIQAKYIQLVLSEEFTKAQAIRVTQADILALAKKQNIATTKLFRETLAPMIETNINQQLTLLSAAKKAGTLKGALPGAVTLEKALTREISASLLLYLKQNTDRVAKYAGNKATSLIDEAVKRKLSGETMEKITADIARQIRDTRTTIRLPSGAKIHDNVAYVRRHLVSQVSIASAQQQIELMDDLDIDEDKKWWETSSHWGARPEHEPWQGKIFKSFAELVDATDYGDVAGLCGVNCRHTFYPFIDGVSTQRFFPKPTKENNKKYADMQRQRAIESNIRKWKLESEVNSALGVDSSRADAKVKEWQAEMRKHIKDTGLTRQYAREQV